jgi:hypothetical protein
VVGLSFHLFATAVIYQFNRVSSRLVLYSSKYTWTVSSVRLECYLVFYRLTMYLVTTGNHIGCTLLNPNPIIFLAYVLIFISETSESKLKLQVVISL